MDLIDDLTWRGLLAQCTDIDALRKRLHLGGVTLYCGFDPTGDSLHVGHLMGLLTLRRFQRAGHRPIVLAGGATGMIGDPSGKSNERNLLTRQQLSHNLDCINAQLARLLDFNSGNYPAVLVDNAEWIEPVSFLDFLRDVGKHFPLSAMLAKDSVKSRLAGDSGISYTEFSYQLLQAHDFYHLRKAHNCELQIGGLDQWGNITAGIEFVRRKLGVPVYGWTFPLITKADGSKFGKTESGAVWLDPIRTSPYRFYQFFMNTEDAKVCEYLRKFSFRECTEIEALEAAHAANPARREAHKALAREVTTLVHGKDATTAAIAASQILFGAEIGSIPEAVFEDAIAEIPNFELDQAQLAGEGASLIDLLVQCGLSASKSQARRDLESGIYVNNQRSGGIEQRITMNDLLFGRHLLLRRGKKSYAALKVLNTTLDQADRH